MSLKEFMDAYSPSYQRVIKDNPEECFFGQYPILSEIDRLYGTGIAESWLVPQLYNLGEVCGVRYKMTDLQMEECAYMISSEFHYLKISELMLFFSRLKAGYYGQKFYGSIDPVVILDTIRNDFVERDRSFAIDRMESFRRLAQIDENRRGAIPFEEYVRLHADDPNFRPLFAQP